MLTVTENAKKSLKEVLVANTDDPETSLRLFLKKSPEGFGLMLDKEAPSDFVVEQEGSKVLLIGPELIDILETATIDVLDTEDGPKLVVSGSYKDKQGT